MFGCLSPLSAGRTGFKWQFGVNSEEYERMYRLEDSYWWFVGRHNLVLTFLDRLYPNQSDLTILDIG